MVFMMDALPGGFSTMPLTVWGVLSARSAIDCKKSDRLLPNTAAVRLIKRYAKPFRA
jgi:hypothetical protein